MIAKRPGTWQRDIEPVVEAIIDERKRLGVTQLQLAQAVGKTQPTLSYLENFDLDPRLSFLSDLVRQLGGTIKYEVIWPKGEDQG